MIIKTKFKDLYLVKNKAFFDKRGYFKELVRENIIKKKFPFHVMSYSKKNVLRGFHFQTKFKQSSNDKNNSLLFLIKFAVKYNFYIWKDY